MSLWPRLVVGQKVDVRLAEEVEQRLGIHLFVKSLNHKPTASFEDPNCMCSHVQPCAAMCSLQVAKGIRQDLS